MAKKGKGAAPRAAPAAKSVSTTAAPAADQRAADGAAPAAPVVASAPAPDAQPSVPDTSAVAVEGAAGGEQSPPASVSTADDQAGDDAVLIGSSEWPALIDVEGTQVQLGGVVAAAHARMGVTAKAWNALEQTERDREIADEVERRRKAAAPAIPPIEERKYKPFDTLSHADQNNPDKIEGEHLRKLGHRLGLSLSEMGRMSDDKVREQLKYIAYNQYER